MHYKFTTYLEPWCIVDTSSIQKNSFDKFDCSKVYDLIRRRGENVSWGKIMWQGPQCRRWSFILWLASKGRLQTRARLFDRGGVDSPDCTFCEIMSETEEYLWIFCPYVKEVSKKFVSGSELVTVLGGFRFRKHLNGLQKGKEQLCHFSIQVDDVLCFYLLQLKG